MSLLGLDADLERLPLAAALDMWASAPQQLGAEPERQRRTCERLCERVRRGDEADAAARAGWLLRALLQRGVADLAPAASRPLAETLRAQVDLLSATDVAALAQAVAADDAALAVLLLDAALLRARRDPAGLAALEAAALAAIEQSPGTWREHSVHPVRDALVDALCQLALHAGEPERAWRLAEAWPPGRSALHGVALGLAAAHELGRLRALLSRYGRGSALRRDVVAALWQDADRRRDDSLATWLATFEPGPEVLAGVRRCTPPALWGRRRAALLEELVELAPDWLVQACAAEPDAAAALEALVSAAVGVPKLAAAAQRTLCDVDPSRALRSATQRLRDAMRTRIAGRRELARLRADLEEAAAACGEPGLATHVEALLAREV